MFSFIKRMSVPFANLGSKVAGGITSLGSKLSHFINVSNTGQTLGNLGVEAVRGGGRSFDFVNIPKFMEQGGNQFLRPFDSMNNMGGFIGGM